MSRAHGKGDGATVGAAAGASKSGLRQMAIVLSEAHAESTWGNRGHPIGGSGWGSKSVPCLEASKAYCACEGAQLKP